MGITGKVVRRFRRRLHVAQICKQGKSSVGRRCVITEETQLEGRNVIHDNVVLDSCSVGFATYIGTRCFFIKTKFGRYCSVAPDVEVIIGDHPKGMVSTHPSFYSTRAFCGLNYGNDFGFNEYRVVPSEDSECYLKVGNDVWLGQGCKLMSGIRVGDGAIIAAYALVTRDVDPYAIVAGIPAKIIGRRFDADITRRLLEVRWWEKSEEWLQKNAHLFENPTLLLDAERMQ